MKYYIVGRAITATVIAFGVLTTIDSAKAESCTIKISDSGKIEKIGSCDKSGIFVTPSVIPANDPVADFCAGRPPRDGRNRNIGINCNVNH